MDSMTNGVDGEIPALQSRIQALETEVKSFGQKRAYFMDIYKRKEGKSGKYKNIELTSYIGRVIPSMKGFNHCLSMP